MEADAGLLRHYLIGAVWKAITSRSFGLNQKSGVQLVWVPCGLELNFYACQCSQSNCAYNTCIIKNILDRICESLVLTRFFFPRLLGWVGSIRANLRLECGLADSINGVGSFGAVEGSSFRSLMTMLSCPISFTLSSSPSLPECQHLGVQRGGSLRPRGGFVFVMGLRSA